jgi:hypothetical protein
MLGPEVSVSPHFRYQVCLARQTDRQPVKADLKAIGRNFMWYH